ncbi:MAG: BamA/TamA family outer membrane protein [Armatimonadetes bacterium]|nr:BamA/TamA family outer membrane protein [Armatimonadota bacterium]
MNPDRRWNILLIVILFYFFINLYSASTSNSDMNEQETVSKLSVFPILMYDSDIGFGFGGKGVIKNRFKRNESFDIILFGSTRGEQWYVFTFSIPDFEIRQGTQYPLALDLKLEYDKFLKSNFFGFGNDSKDNSWQFPLELAKLELILGHAFTESVIAEAGLIYDHTSVYGYKGVNPLLTSDILGTGENLTSSITGRIRWDTRDSSVHPRKGWKIYLGCDLALKSLGGDHDFNRYQLEICHYRNLFSPDHILAFRQLIQHVDGFAPYYEQSIIGGTWTARGYKADRFIDKTIILTSMEYRFRVYKWIGVVLFGDSGRVYRSLKKISLQDWHNSWGAGLRFYPGAFVVRFDIGMSREGTRIFFNFGHVY